MKRPSISGNNSTLQKHNIVAESMCNRKKDRLHYHDYVQIWYVLTGVLQHSVGNTEYLQTAGSCVIVLPFTEHAINTLDSEDTPVALSVSFTDSFFTAKGFDFFSYLKEYAHFEGYSIPEYVLLHGSEKEAADRLARNMLSEFSPKSNPDFHKLSGFLRDFMRLLCRDPAQKKDLSLIIERTEPILRAVRYIATHSSEKIKREDLCALTAMSRTNFSKAFKEVTGTTTKDFLLGLRIRRAQYLLQYTDKSLNEIAADTGLYDKSRLTHIFREHFGISPVQFRYKTRPEAIESDKQTRRRMKFYPKSLHMEHNE